MYSHIQYSKVQRCWIKLKGALKKSLKCLDMFIVHVNYSFIHNIIFDLSSFIVHLNINLNLYRGKGIRRG